MTKQEIIKKIYAEVDNLPPIPDVITKTNELINDPNSSIKEISSVIKQDPSLTADILKLANSAWYITRSSVETIEQATSIIGLKQLSTIMLSIGAKKVLKERYESMEEVWNHSYKCAFFSKYLMKMITRQVDDIESAYLAGLLHDIGKIVLLSITPELSKRIILLSEAKNVSIVEIERLALGLTHADIGGKITENWNFPTKMTIAISYHHTPKLYRKTDWQNLMYTVYFANMLSHVSKIDNNEIITKINSNVLELFKIDSNEKIEKVLNTLNEFYSSVGDTQKL